MKNLRKLTRLRYRARDQLRFKPGGVFLQAAFTDEIRRQSCYSVVYLTSVF